MRVARSHGGGSGYVLTRDEVRHVAARVNGRSSPTCARAPRLRAAEVGDDDRRRLAVSARPIPLPTDPAAALRLMEEHVAEWF
jgi:hypothetical protein